MKYLVQVWTKASIGREGYAYTFDLRSYSFMKAYQDVNTTVLVVKNDLRNNILVENA